MNEDLDIQDVYDEKKNQFKKRKSKLPKEDDEDTIQIKEFDINSLPPNSATDTKNGVKIVVIGKPGCFAPGTLVLMFNGTIKKIEDIQVGDILMGDDNTPRNVIELFHNREEMFEIKPQYGTSYTVNKGHSLVLKSLGLIPSHPKDSILEITVGEYLLCSKDFQDNFHCYRSSGITCWYDNETIATSSYQHGQELALSSSIDSIPFNYKMASSNTRLEVLAGIIDSIGIYNEEKDYIELHHLDSLLLNDIIFLSRSLGFSIDQINESTINFYIHENHNIPFRTTNLKSIHKKSSLSTYFDISSKGEGEYFGFSIDQNRRFLLASFEVVRNSGKSTVIKDIIASKAHILATAQIFSGTEDSNAAYSKHFPPCCIYNKLDLDAVQNFIVRQKLAIDWLPNPWALQLLDDCTEDPSILRKPIFQAIFKNGRHWRMMFILSLQYCMDVLPSIRTTIDYTFILREPNQKSREALYKNYANAIPNYAMFEQIMDTITEDYTALVINNRVQSNKISDCVFWYRAHPDKIPDNIKFCSDTAWAHDQERYNPDYKESII